MKKKKVLTLFVVQCVVAVVLMVAIGVGSGIAFYYENEISSVLAPPIVEQESLSVAAEEGQKMSARIMEEGSVLLRNENKTLPLSADISKVNVFGWHSIDWLYGTGGGMVSSGGVLPEDDDFSKNVDFYKALNEYGIEYNEDLYQMYRKYFSPYYLGREWKVGDITSAMNLVEPRIDDKKYYSDTLLNGAKAYSDTAFMVISRLCGEGGDCPKSQPKEGPNGTSVDNSRHFLEISEEEELLLTYLGANFENVIVLINTCNQFELGFLESIPGIDACLYVGYTGTRGAIKIPSLLYGDVSPSGKLTDTFAYDLFTNPSVIWTTTAYEGSNTGDHMDKMQGVYIGYKWYETADVMNLWSAENGYENGYDGVVQYPFGFGMSYTTFEWTVDDIKVDGTSVATDSAKITESSVIEFTVTVKNTGDTAGRDVVEIFGTAPYTPGGIEKSAVELVGYGKTNVIEPKASETIVVTVNMYDIASYDCYDKNGNGIKGYELDKGKYTFKLSTDSHTVNTVSYKGESIRGEFDFILNETKHIAIDPVTKQPVKNLFTGEDAVDIVPIDDTTSTFTPDIPWLTRESFPTPEELKEAVKRKRQKNPALANYDKASYARWQEWDNATVDVFGNPVEQTKPIWGASGNKKLAENGVITELGKKLGADYDAPEWEDVLNQVKFSEALDVINKYYGSKAIDSVGKPRLIDLDGPTQVRGYNTAPRGTGYPSMVVIAQTWNQRLAYEFGQSFGNDMKVVGVTGLWGFACDLHLDAFFGRNNESPSEDPFLAGTTMANAVRGVNTRGRYTFLKHFAVYQSSVDQTFMSEQTLRETYLKAFRKAFVDGGALGTMTSYQSVGAEISNYSQGLITGVLRGEWMFKGSITSDASAGMDFLIEGLIRVGGNYGMGVSLGATGMTYSESATAGRMQNKMREAVHQILYTWLRTDYNERIYLETADDNNTYFSSVSINSWEWWKPFLWSLDAVFACVVVFWLLCATVDFVNKVKQPAVNSAITQNGDAELLANIRTEQSAADVVNQYIVDEKQEESATEQESETDFTAMAQASDAADEAATAELPTEQPVERPRRIKPTPEERAAQSQEVGEEPKKQKNPPIKRTPEERAQLLEERAEKQIERAEKGRERAEQAAKKAEELKAKADSIRIKAAETRSKSKVVTDSANENKEDNR